MNKFVKEQLLKVQTAQLPEYNDDSTEIIIPKLQQDRYLVGGFYLVKLEDILLNPNGSPLLVSNYNHGTYPRSKYMKVDVIKTVGKMICVNGIGYDIDTKQNTSYTWGGWLPVAQIKQIEDIK